MALGARQTTRALHQLRDQLMSMALRRWRDDGWAIQPHLMHKPSDPVLAWIDEDEHLIHVYPHEAGEGQPVEKTLLHELFHVLFQTMRERARDEKDCLTLETLLWPILTRSQRRALTTMLANGRPT